MSNHLYDLCDGFALETITFTLALIVKKNLMFFVDSRAKQRKLTNKFSKGYDSKQSTLQTT